MSAQEHDLSATLVCHRATFVRYARARLGNDDAAEDVVHDLWVKLQGRACGEADDALPYLYRALANAVTDHLRSGARRRRLIDEAGAEEAEAAADEQPDSERIAIGRSRAAWIERIVAALPASAAYALRCARVDGHSHREIAGLMGISVSGVEKHLQRAYKALLAAQRSEAGDAQPATEVRP